MVKFRLRLLPALLFFVLVPLAALADQPLEVRLDNGFRVVVQRLDRAPVVAVQVWVKAGSRLEEPAERGITHQIEHMIFKGTPSRGLGQVAGQIESAGGRINAYTSFDHTVYHCVLPAAKWALGVDVLGDAIQNSLFDAEELEREKQVVLEEWRRGQDSPHRLLAETVLATAFFKSPYRHPIIGTAETIQAFTRQQILDYMAKWYTADRMSLVVVGQVDPQAVLARARQVFGQIPSASQASFDPPLEPPQRDVRFKAIFGRVKQAYLALAFRTHGFNAPRPPASDLLAELLGGGQTARLTDRLWGRQGLVNSIQVNSFTPLDEGLMWISASLDPARLEEVVAALWQELKKTTTQHFSPQEMARAKLAFKASFIRDKETMEGQASKLGFFLTIGGGLDKEAAYLEQVMALSAEDIRRRAERIFRPSNLSLVVMLPEGSPLPDSKKIVGLLTPSQTNSPSAQAEGAQAEAAQPQVSVPVEGSDGTKAGQVQSLPLPGGAKLLVVEDHSLPLWAIRAVFLGGVRLEPAPQAGAMRLMANCWTRGADGLTAEALARKVEDMAGRLNAESGRNTFTLSGEFLSQFLGEGLELFSQVLLRPAFEPGEVAKRRADQLAALKAKEERPEAVAFRLFAQAVYAGHPYARDPLGQEKTLKQLTAGQLKDLHQRLVRADNLVLAVVGDVSAAQVHQRLKRLLAPLKGGFEPVLPDPPAALPVGGTTVDETRSGLTQNHILLGFRAPPLTSEESYPLDILAEALANQSGRLFVELRDKKSLAYSLTAFNSAGLDTGSFGFYIASAPEKEAQVKREIVEQVEQIRREPLTEAEVQGAKARLLARWIIDRQSLGLRAMDLALYDRLGLGWDYARQYAEAIKALTPDKIQEAARRYLDLSRPLWIRVGPAE
ncbi:MAG: insulinase family protein [Deltaproteobacteria bacterium]|nr:insulinase family protein [Deltaproteobacteria bacterium]